MDESKPRDPEIISIPDCEAHEDFFTRELGNASAVDLASSNSNVNRFGFGSFSECAWLEHPGDSQAAALAEHEFETAWNQPSLNVDVSDLSIQARDWNQVVAASLGQNRVTDSNLSLPWETGVFGEIFGAVESHPLPENHGLLESKDEAVFEEHRLVPTVESLGSLPSDAKYVKAVKGGADLDYFESKNAQLELACGQWMQLLSHNWDASCVGVQLPGDLQRDHSGESALQTLKACFGVKSPSTLLKRVSAFRKYRRWFDDTSETGPAHVQALPPHEADVWNFFLSLKETRLIQKKGHSS